MQKRRRKFGAILISEGLITREQLQAALERQEETGVALGEILLNEKVITETDVVRCICIQYQLPFIRPSDYDLDPKYLNRFSGEFLYKYRMVPLDRIGSCCTMALAEIVESPEVEREIIAKMEAKPYYFFSPMTDVEKILRDHFKLSQEDMIRIDGERRVSYQQATQPAATVTLNEDIFDEVEDSSWESIFDEAEKNITQE